LFFRSAGPVIEQALTLNDCEGFVHLDLLENGSAAYYFVGGEDSLLKAFYEGSWVSKDENSFSLSLKDESGEAFAGTYAFVSEDDDLTVTVIESDLFADEISEYELIPSFD